MEKKRTRDIRFWVLVWGLGLVGQLCWNIENQWFNTFVYAKIAKDPTIISWMVAISAIATTIATFLFGTLSDRKGKRKNFIGIGYILWGIFTILFGTTEWITGGQPASSAQVLMLAATAVVCADALMSFFGSMGNDAGYNAWLNDMMTEQNRGSIGAALATQPIIGTIVGTVVGGMLIGGSDNYMRLFVVMGGFVILFGIAAILFMKDAPQLKPSKNGSFGKQLFSAFNFRDCPFADSKLLFAQWLKRNLHIPIGLIWPILRRRAKRKYGYDVESVCPIAAVQGKNVPICLMHGKSDNLIPYTHSEMLHKACVNPNSELHLFENADHARSIVMARTEYERLVLAFLHNCGLYGTENKQ